MEAKPAGQREKTLESNGETNNSGEDKQMNKRNKK
jgi:hypothetical protein